MLLLYPEHDTHTLKKIRKHRKHNYMMFTMTVLHSFPRGGQHHEEMICKKQLGQLF